MNTSWLTEDLEQLENAGLRRHLHELSSAQGRRVIVDGKEALNFCSNNYLGLADDPRLIMAAAKAMEQYGFGSGASRLVCGNMSIHEELESKIAQLKGTESCLLFNSGYTANTGIIPALFGRDDIIFCDKLNHASIIDGIILSRAEFIRYPHADMHALEKELKQSGSFKRRLIVTDTVFSMDGDIAPLSEITDLARRYDAMVMTDDAHGFGVIDLPNEAQIQMGTLSKAAGCFGAYVCCSSQMREYLINHARSFIYTTALPPAIVAAALMAVDIIAQDGDLRKRLQDNADYVRRGLNSKGFDTQSSTLAIIPVVVKDSVKAVAMSKRLLEKGILVQAIRPPTVPANTARLRITAMATHTKEDLDHLLNCMDGL